MLLICENPDPSILVFYCRFPTLPQACGLSNPSLLFCSSRGQKSAMGLTGLKLGINRTTVFLCILGRMFPCLFQLLETGLIPCLLAPFLHLQSQQIWAKSFSHCHSSGPPSGCLPVSSASQVHFLRTLMNSLGPPK